MKSFRQLRLHEAKDKGEYDYEGAMAMTQLRIIVKNAQELMNDLTPEQNLPEWVQSKITLAEDYITTAYNYVCNSVDEAVAHPDEKEDKILIKKIVKKMLKVKEAYSDPYAAKKAAEIKKAHADTMTDAKKEYDASKKNKFDKNFMKMKSEDFVTEIIYKQTRNGKLRKERPSVVDAHNAEVAERGRGAKEIETNKKSVKEEVHLDEVITKKTPTGEVISDFVHSKNPTFAGKSKKERIRMALGAKYGMMKKEDTEMATEEFKKGDTVYPKVGIHSGDPHKIFRSYEDGTHDIVPTSDHPKRNKYRFGMKTVETQHLSATKPASSYDAVKHQKIIAAARVLDASRAAETKKALQGKKADMHKEEVELNELKNKTLRSYRYKAKIAAPTTRAPGHERAGEILKTRKDAHLAKKAAKKLSSSDRLAAKTKDTHPYGADN